MEYLENAFKFWGRYIFLIVPLLIMNSVLMLIGAPAVREISNVLNRISETARESGETAGVNVYEALVQMTPNLTSLIFAGILALLLSIFILPATYGMIIKGYETGAIGFGDFFTSLKRNFIKFIPHFFSVLLSVVAIVIILILALILFTIIFSFSWQLGFLFFAVIIIGLIITICLLFNIFNISFIAMAWDNMKLSEAFLKSFKLVKSYLWSSIGITFVMGLLYITINALIGGVLDTIFIIGSVFKGFLISMCIYVLIVFGFEIYRDRTNKKTVLGDYL